MSASGRRRGEDGKFVSEVEDEELIDFISDKERVLTEEVADFLDYTHNGAEKRLKKTEGIKKCSSGVNLWTIEEDSYEQ